VAGYFNYVFSRIGIRPPEDGYEYLVEYFAVFRNMAQMHSMAFLTGEILATDSLEAFRYQGDSLVA
jgi:hypothetical protein